MVRGKGYLHDATTTAIISRHNACRNGHITMDAAPTAFKAIETVYNGYRFRSRLEARWAVFFDTLGIEYRYEPEGFDLEGIRYLPDFWLPSQKYWIEIKGQKPTEAESKKAELLALHTPYEHRTLYVHILAGDVWLPPGYTTHTYMIPHFDLRPPSGIRTTKDFKAWLPTVEVVELFRKMEPIGLHLHADKTGQIYLTANLAWTFKIEEVKSLLIDHRKVQAFNEIISLIDQHRKELEKIFRPVTWGWTVRFVDADTIDTYCWCECTHCGRITIDNPGFKCLDCGENDARYINDSPRLKSAYAAARSARFEHGESGGVE